MPKYTVRYESREHYEKVYEADSAKDAQQMYWEDDKLWESKPYDSETNLIEIEDEEGEGVVF